MIAAREIGCETQKTMKIGKGEQVSKRANKYEHIYYSHGNTYAGFAATYCEENANSEKNFES